MLIVSKAIQEAILAAEIRGLERAQAIAHKRAGDFHTSECGYGSVEHDTNAFVCSLSGDCLCIEREEEAATIESEIADLIAKTKFNKGT